MPISAFAPKSGHTFYYIRKQICTDIPRGIPIFSCPIIGTQIVTHLGISHLFVTLRSANHWGHFLRHLHFLPIFSWHTYNDTHWDIPTFLSPTQRDIFYYILSFCQTNNRDTSCDTPLITQTRNQLRLEIILIPELSV